MSNDRPVFTGDLSDIRWRPPGSAPAPALAASFSLPAIGRTGNLPRNAGRGPALYTFDLTLARDFPLSERARLRPAVEIGNLLNTAVYLYTSNTGCTFHQKRDVGRLGQRAPTW